MKLAQSDNSKNCKAVFRNLSNNQPFNLRIEYHNPTVTIMILNGATGKYETCLEMYKELDFEGIFVISAGSSMRNPDRVYLDQFAVYNPEVDVTKEEQQKEKEQRRESSIEAMSQYNTAYLTKDLIHSTDSITKKEQFGEANLLDMLPTQLTNTKNSMTELLQQMYNNYNYFYKVIEPLHSNKNFTAQQENIDQMITSLKDVKEQIA